MERDSIIVDGEFINVETGDYLQFKGDIFKVIDTTYQDDKFELGVVIIRLKDGETEQLGDVTIKSLEEVSVRRGWN